jgi:hypothetical protein
MKKALLKFIEAARVFGLNETYINQANEYLEYNEYGLCLDTIAVQMYEADIEITDDFYNLIAVISEKMKLPTNSYSYMKELIRSKENIPASLKKEIAKIVNMLA